MTVTLAALGGGSIEVEASAVEALADALDGELLVRGDDGFDDATQIWNGMIDNRPSLVARPAATADVAACVNFAREHGALISAKCGGHNIAGTALADGGFTLDLSRLRRVDVDPDARTARVQAGCLIGDVDQATQKHALATVLGFVSETGVAGLTLGGGFGYLARRFGWAVDNLLEVEIVTADGKVRRASPREHEDLFWAVRGAGHNVGIVTEFVFRLHEVGPEIVGGLVAYPAETPDQVDAALQAYRDVTASAPRELTVFLMLQRAPPAPFVPAEWRGRRVAGFLICHTGNEDEAYNDLTPLTGALGKPAVDLVGRRLYVDQQALIDATQPNGMHYYWKSEWHAELDDGLLEVLRDAFLENPGPMNKVGLVHIAGALNERASHDGAVGNRDARYGSGLLGMWEPGDVGADRHRAWARDAWTRCRPFSTGGHYINFETADEDEGRVAQAYGKNFDRLVEVKTKYDPANLFRSNRNVAPRPERDRTR